MSSRHGRHTSLDTRGSGILLHPTSLPGGHGIGDLGAEAYHFVDFLHQAKQSIWHVLPTGPGVAEEFHCPYATISAFAHDPLLISLDRLVEEGLLERGDLRRAEADSNVSLRAESVDFRAVERFKIPLLRRAAKNFQGVVADRALADFSQRNPWVEEFAQFAALRMVCGPNRLAWPSALRKKGAGSESYCESAALKDEIRVQKVLQFVFAEQWSRLRSYAHSKGVALYGDVPLYVSGSGADVWAHPEVFALDPATGAATSVSGVPPDMCNPDGQRWGHPLYDWEHLKASGYRWWLERFRAIGALFDVVRIDHFPGIAQYWSIPVDAPSARDGRWRQGPGADFLSVLLGELEQFSVYVEDLGVITDEMIELRDAFGLMGIRILQYAFDGDEHSLYEGDHAPHRTPAHAVVCTGNHDNAPIAGWYAGLSEVLQERVRRFLGGCSGAEVREAFMRLAMSLSARVCIVQMQDVMGLGDEARMNRPGILDWSNWSWRLREIPDQLAPSVARMVEEYERAGVR
jgi:4-alpha-glucanotransferase